MSTSAALKVVVDGDVLTVVTDEDVQVNIYNMQGSEVVQAEPMKPLR